MIEVRIESGIETAMISVLRQLPRKIRIISPVRHAAIIAFADHAADRRAHEDRLIGKRLDLQFRRQRRCNARQSLASRPPRHSSVEASPFFRTGHQRAALPIQPDNIGLRRESVGNRGHVADVNGRVVHHLDRHVVQFRNLQGTGVQIDVVFELPDLRRARGQDQILVVRSRSRRPREKALSPAAVLYSG